MTEAITAISNAEILLVDDDLEDARLVERAMNRTHINRQLRHVASGRDALAYLSHEKPYERADLPGLVLLDWNMPGMNGQQTLSQIRQIPNLQNIAVVVWTTSTAARDIQSGYDAGANAFVTKPVGIEGLTKALVDIEEFWFHVCRLPPPPNRTQHGR
jgi:chemotaxis family two-component system response regulator Rcp1